MTNQKKTYRPMPPALSAALILMLAGAAYAGLSRLGDEIPKQLLRSSSPKLGDFLAASGTAPRKNPQAGTYALSRVVDGDTIAVRQEGKERKVRMIGLNAPESVDPRRPVECFGREASAHLKELLASSAEVRLEFDPSQGMADKYGRLLAYVIRSDGANLNEVQIADGYAYEYTYRLPYKYQAEFKAAERAARAGEKGLWNPGTCNGRP